MIAEEHYVSSELLPHTKEVVKAARPHQQDALAALYNAAQAYDRYTCVMACGTGKTLVGLWHAEQLQARKILVLLPSLGLINQTLHEWLHNTSLSSLKYLCVCSDLSVGSDEDLIQYRAEELDFYVTTQSIDIAQFLNICTSNDTIVIFSTYHSAQAVAKGAGKDYSFDLIIFDEAHKTAGEVGKAFSYALYDRNIKAYKRLFMTATPRVLNQYQVNHIDNDSIIKHYISMCDKSLYGSIAYQLSFKKAVTLGIIVDYKIVISIVTSEMVEKILRYAKLKFKNKKTDALNIAHMLAIEYAAQEHGIKKLITFHSRVGTAHKFQAIIDEHWFEILNDFNAQHVSGRMRASKRSRNIYNFKNSDKSVLTNARCLTEGVDVPEVDMIAFLCNKKSRVDIVQAAGRVMRKSPNKHIGYILIPFYIHSKNDDIKQYLENIKYSDYSDVWHILKILADYDETLKDVINMTRIRQDELGDTITSILNQKLTIAAPKELSIDVLKNSIKTLTIKSISDDWDYYYEQLKKFKQQHGHCKVPSNDNANKTLGYWVSNQRRLVKHEMLSLDRRHKLEALGFVWDIKEAHWQAMYAELITFHKEYGHGSVSKSYSANKVLGRWVGRQRSLAINGALSTERRYKLEALGIVLEDAREANWQEMYVELVAFKENHGHCNVPLTHTANPSLGRWVKDQRQRYRYNKLTQNRIRLLNKLCFIWDIPEVNWLGMYDELVVFHKKYGHCNVPTRYAKNPSLGGWVNTQRRDYRHNMISSERKYKLEVLGFVWEIKKAHWQVMYAQLIAFQQKHGHCNVRRCYPDTKALGEWVSGQRRNYKLHKLEENQINLLNKLGFVWDALESRWQERYADLITFKQKHGHCNVPLRDPENKTFGLWVYNQRCLYRNGKLSNEHKQKLEALGFIWDINKVC